MVICLCKRKVAINAYGVLLLNSHLMQLHDYLWSNLWISASDLWGSGWTPNVISKCEFTKMSPIAWNCQLDPIKQQTDSRLTRSCCCLGTPNSLCRRQLTTSCCRPDPRLRRNRFKGSDITGSVNMAAIICGHAISLKCFRSCDWSKERSWINWGAAPE